MINLLNGLLMNLCQLGTIFVAGKQLYLTNIPIHLGNCKISVAKKNIICKSKVRSNIDIKFHDYGNTGCGGFQAGVLN